MGEPVAIAGWTTAALIAVVAAFLWVSRSNAMARLARAITELDEHPQTRIVSGRYVGRLAQLVVALNETLGRRAERVRSLGDDYRLVRKLLDGMGEGVIAVDSRRKLLFANAAAKALFGFEQDQLGQLLAQVVRSPQFQQVAEATLQAGTSHREEVVVTPAKAGGVEPGPLTLALHGSVLALGAETGAVIVFHDVTELRRLERMRQDFVANVSHELKTPLASIKAYAETLLDGALHDDTVNRDFVGRIEAQADRLSQLVVDMLSLARLEGNNAPGTHAALPVLPRVKAAVEAHEARAQAKGQQLSLRTGGVDETTLVRADGESLRQVLDNLIDNAIKYTPQGGRVTVTCRIRSELFEVAVTDDGIGIARDELPRIFERFYRVDQARGADVPGTGLGLAIVKHQIQALGGRISVRSRLNAGSTFTVALPRVGASSRPHHPAA